MTHMHIPVAEPFFDHTEEEYVANAVRERAVSGSFGDYIARFENGFAEFCACNHAISVSNGTTAIHLALATLNIRPPDEVLVAAYTNMATFFPVHYQGATPIPIDIEPDTWNINTDLIEGKITSKSKAIVVVHIFGHPVDMDAVLKTAAKHDLFVIEDCAQAHGALYKGKPVGGLGTMGCFSFYANKIITTGEGGMVTMNDAALARRAASLKSLAYGRKNKFLHDDIGYNYRMPNVQAAIGCAQLDKIGSIIEMKRSIARRYSDRLGGIDALQLPIEREYAKNVYWMYHVVLRDTSKRSRDSIMAALQERGIETRPGFIPYNMQNTRIRSPLVQEASCPVANQVGARGFYLPSGPLLSDEEIDYVCENLRSLL